MGAHVPLAFSDIANAINDSKSGQLASATIATRLGRGVHLVQRALNQMVAIKVARKADGDGDVPVYEIIAPVPEAAIHGRAPIERAPRQEIADDLADGDDDDTGSLTLAEREAAAAARLWQERMGGQRWTNDPRATREASRCDYLQPPFGAGA